MKSGSEIIFLFRGGFIMIDVTALGELLIDFTPYGTADDGCHLFGRNPGGAPANLLATVSRYGGKTALITKVGSDIFGDFLIDVLRKNKISTEGVVRDDIHNTTLAFVELNVEGDRSFSFYRRFGADIFLTPEEVNSELIRNSKVFHFGSLSLTNEPAVSATDCALKTAKDSGCVITYDPNYRAALWPNEAIAAKKIREYVPFAEIIKVSREEAQMITGIESPEKAAKEICGMGSKIALVTDGGNGVTYAAQGCVRHVPAVAVKAEDTTGAGDIFFGSFISSLLKLEKPKEELQIFEIESCVERAVKTAGLSTTKKGAITSIPNEKEVDKG